jgi:hypothetical protein
MVRFYSVLMFLNSCIFLSTLSTQEKNEKVALLKKVSKVTIFLSCGVLKRDIFMSLIQTVRWLYKGVSDTVFKEERQLCLVVCLFVPIEESSVSILRVNYSYSRKSLIYKYVLYSTVTFSYISVLGL